MKFRTSDGLNLEYFDEGEGTPVLCLPGLTRHAGDFEDLASWLSGVRLIRLTLRGRKGSDFDPAYLNYNVAQEAKDVIEFLDFLGLEKVVLVGTSRGGLISMVLGATVAPRVAGMALNDIGPAIEDRGLDHIMTYLGVEPKAKDHARAAQALKLRMGAAFPGLPDEKWLDCARHWFDQGPEGLVLNYDPKLRDAVIAQSATPAPDLWPLFDLLAGIPMAVIRGEHSDILSDFTVREMQRRHPGLITAEVPARGHVPFLDEPESRQAIRALLARAA